MVDWLQLGRLLGSRFPLVALTAWLVGCTDTNIGIIIAYDEEDLLDNAVGFEVHLLTHCDTSVETGQDPTSPRRSFSFRKGTNVPSLYSLQPGSYGLYVRVRDDNCKVIGYGCSDFELAERREDDVRVSVKSISGPSCDETEFDCEYGLCEEQEDHCPAEPGWTKSWEGVLNSHVSVAIGPDGMIVAVSPFAYTIDLDPGPGVVELTPLYVRAYAVRAFDESGELIWGRAIDGSGDFYPTGLDILRDGSIALTGIFDETIDLDPSPGVNEFEALGVDTYDSFIMTFTPTGELRFSGTLSGPQNVQVRALSSNGTDFFALGGSFGGTADFNPAAGVLEHTSTGDRDGFIMLVDGDGTPIWLNVFEGEFDQDVRSVAIRADPFTQRPRAVVATGEFTGTADLNPGPELMEQSPLGEKDVFVVRLDGDGGYDWSGCISGESNISVVDTAITPGDEIVLVGEFSGNFDFDPGPGENFQISSSDSESSTDSWMIRLNSNGALQWFHNFRDEGNLQLVSVAPTPDSSILIVGNLSGRVALDPDDDEIMPEPAGASNGVIEQVSYRGEYVWSRVVDASLQSSITDIAVSNDGWMVVGGLFSALYDFDPGPCTDEHEPTGIGGVFITKLESNGTYSL